MSDIAALSVNTIRTLSIDAIQKANSGHPGLPLGAAPMAYILWQNHLRHNPADPAWPNRDRFVLSAGHGSMLVYSLLHLTGYSVSLDDIKAFRQRHSKTPGHPEFGETPGVEATTGPLGQGTANAVGMAMAERALAHRYNRPGHCLIDHFTYALVSDGDLMEGVAAEAASLAGHLGLGKLIYLYDDNAITLDGPTSMTFTGEDVTARYRAYGWQVLEVMNGDGDLAGIDEAIAAAKAETERPSLIRIHTTIGFGSPNKAGTASAHGSPLGEEELAATKTALGWDPEKHFHVPAEVAEHCDARDRGGRLHQEWLNQLEAYTRENPELAAEWELAWAGDLPDGWDIELPTWQPGESIATRAAAGKVENAIARRVPWLVGGDADLGGSTKTTIGDGGSFDGRSGSGRNVHFGVREHAMGAICNGIDYHGGLRPFAATFFCFSDYMRPPVRIAAMNGQSVIYVWTHDSIALGEDGPTHQPVEHLMSLRAMPNLYVVRPADANEAREAWCLAMRRGDGPTALIFSRQGLPVLDLGDCNGLHRGAYVVGDFGGEPHAMIIATGSEVSIAVDAAAVLAREGIATRVVSMPCWEAFSAQSSDYRDSVLPPELRARVSVEAGVTMGWHRWVGDGVAIGIDRFGASAPASELLHDYGITPDAVAKAVRELVG